MARSARACVASFLSFFFLISKLHTKEGDRSGGAVRGVRR
jgi:hypothetical protein